MDDARIRELTDEVMGHLRQAPKSNGLLEARVAALEAAVSRLAAQRPAVTASAAVVAVPVAIPAAAPVATHPALQLLRIPGPATDYCTLEPDKPCVGSGQCRTFGY